MKGAFADMNTKLTSLLLAGTAAIAITFGSGSASATSFTGVCPNVVGHAAAGVGSTGSASGCTIGISVNSSSLTIHTGLAPNGDTGLVTSTTGGLDYEGNEDVLVGIRNTGTGTLGSITLNGTNLFGFESPGADGIDFYAGLAIRAAGDTTCAAAAQTSASSCYGGPISFFTNITAGLDSGTVNFIGGLAAGAATYFSLELPTSGGICSTVSQCPHTPFNAPEPASLALLGSGLLGLAGLRSLRRRRQG